MNSDNIVFEEFENNGTVGQLCRFSVSNRRYITLFAYGAALTQAFLGQFDQAAQFAETISINTSYQIKFFGEDYWEQQAYESLYATPQDGLNFTFRDITQLEQQLMAVVSAHSRTYCPDIYYFIPETKPLARMYARMYNARQDHLVEFETLFPDHTEFFILKKRSCHANQNSKIHQI